MTTHLKKPEAILFDWDNTLADTWPVIHASLENTFKYFNMEPWTLDEVKLRVHKSLRDSFPPIFGDQWEKAGEVYLSHFKAIHLDYLTMLPLATDVIEHLATTDVYLAVVSNKTGCNLRAELNHIKLNHHFPKIIGATDAPQDKPAPAPVLMALEHTSLTPNENIWFIGDSLTDMETAYNTGCFPVLFGDKDPECETMAHCRPKLHIRDHQELLDIVKKF